MNPRRLSNIYDRAAQRADKKGELVWSQGDSGTASKHFQRAINRREKSDLAWGVGQDHPFDIFILPGLPVRAGHAPREVPNAI